MFYVLLVIHVLISFALILIILSQSSKGGAIDGLVGGTAMNMLGSQGATSFMKKLTRIFAGAFMLTSILMAVLVNNQHRTGKTTPDTPALEMIQEEAAEGEATDATTTEVPVTEPMQIEVKQKADDVKAQPQTSKEAQPLEKAKGE